MKTKRAVVFSDLHIHDYKQYNKDGKRLDNCLKVLLDIWAFCKKEGIDTILFAGDLYDQQKVLPVEVVNKTISTFIKLAQSYPNIKVYAISGNHDHGTKNLQYNEAVSAIQHIEYIVPENFVIIDNKTAKIADGIYVHGIPYYEFKEDYQFRFGKLCTDQAYLQESDLYDTDTKQYLLIHQTPKSLENAMIPYETDPTDGGYAWFDHVFCGHIHNRQVLSPNFTIVGSPIHRDMADKGKKKGFLVLDLHQPKQGVEFVYLKNYPEFLDEGEATTEQVEDNFIVPESVAPVLDTAASVADFKKFDSAINPYYLMQNFWEEVTQGSDKNLLYTGMELLVDYPTPDDYEG